MRRSVDNGERKGREVKETRAVNQGKKGERDREGAKISENSHLSGNVLTAYLRVTLLN